MFEVAKMKLEYRQNQEQKQLLSPKMMQSVEILQMDTLELEAYVQNQALENPLIDLEEMERGISCILHSEDDIAQKRRDELQKKLEWLNRTDEQNRVYYREEFEETETKNYLELTETENNFQEYLLSQLIIQMRTPLDSTCLEYLVYNLDSRGYLEDTPKQLACDLNLDTNTVLHYLSILQSIEPAGVGARNLEECLCLQLHRIKDNGLLKQEDYEILTALIQKDMDALSRKHFSQIAAKHHIPEKTVRSCYQFIQDLNPIPSNSFSSRESIRYIQPDVTVVKFEDHFEILVNDMYLPKISVNSNYLELLQNNPSPEVTAYLQDKLERLQWLNQCIENRSSTLMRVTKEILTLQKDFFEHPDGKRTPMSLKDVADRLNIHESTVSCTIKNKFLQCPWGVYPLNYFFIRKSLLGNAKEAISSEEVKQIIQEMIQSEDPAKPYSDQKLADLLGERGISVSRRTVAKYRNELLIPDKAGRKI